MRVEQMSYTKASQWKWDEREPVDLLYDAITKSINNLWGGEGSVPTESVDECSADSSDFCGAVGWFML